MRNLFLWALLICGTIQGQQVIETRPLITVTGEATEKALPDLIIIHYTFKFNIDRPTADHSSFPEQDWLLQSFKFTGIPSEDISVGMETVKNNPSFYTATREYVFTLKDIKKYKEVLNQLVRLEKGEITAIEYRTTKLEEYKNKARINAIQSAREKGIQMAAVLGQNIGKAYTIVDEPTPLINWYDKTSLNTIENLYMINDVYLIIPGFISIPAKVKVSFELN